MRLLYLICSIIIGLLVLIISVAQFGAACSWYLLSPSTHPVVVLLGVALLGAAGGACFILFAVAPSENAPSDMDEEA